MKRSVAVPPWATKPDCEPETTMVRNSMALTAKIRLSSYKRRRAMSRPLFSSSAFQPLSKNLLIVPTHTYESLKTYV